MAATVVHRLSDINKMLKEFAGHVFISRVFARQLHGDGEHVEAVHPHPTGAVGLLNVAAGGKRFGAVKHPDVVESQEPSLENVPAIGVLAIHPPGEIEQELVKDLLEKLPIRAATPPRDNRVYAPRRPGMYGRVDVAEGPLVSRELAIGV